MKKLAEKFFGQRENTTRVSSKHPGRKARNLHMEALEERHMLSVSALLSGSSASDNDIVPAALVAYDARIKGASIEDGIANNAAIIETATLYGGTLNNYGNAVIGAVFLSGSSINTFDNATIGTLLVPAGETGYIGKSDDGGDGGNGGRGGNGGGGRSSPVNRVFLAKLP